MTRGRVLGILAVARSFGDHGMKDFVLAQPHICEVNLDLKHHPFLILACDGACFGDICTNSIMRLLMMSFLF